MRRVKKHKGGRVQKIFFDRQLCSVLRPRGVFFYTQLSMKFQLLIKTLMLKNEHFSCFKTPRCSIYHVYNVKMPTIVGTLTFMRGTIFILSCVEHEKYHNLAAQACKYPHLSAMDRETGTTNLFLCASFYLLQSSPFLSLYFGSLGMYHVKTKHVIKEQFYKGIIGDHFLL